MTGDGSWTEDGWIYRRQSGSLLMLHSCRGSVLSDEYSTVAPETRFQISRLDLVITLNKLFIFCYIAMSTRYSYQGKTSLGK